MKRGYGALPLLLSVLFSLVAVVGCVIVMMNAPQDSVPACVLMTAVFFAATLVLGYIGLEFGLLFNRKKYRTVGRRNPLLSLILAIVLGAGIGAVSGTVYSIDRITYTDTITVPGEFAGTHIVMLMDGSTSMDEEKAACAEAACQLIDSLDASVSLQFIAFAKNVADRNVSDFLPMNTVNRAAMKDFVRDVDLAGGTNFDIPLNMALETLRANDDGQHSQIILMLTDGWSTLDGSVKRALQSSDNDVKLYTVRLTDGGPIASADIQAMVDDLVALADQDFPIVIGANNSVDISEVLAAFQAALAAGTSTTVVETHTKLGFVPALMFHAGNTVHWWRILASALGLAAAFAAAAVVYYGSVGIVRSLLNIVLGAAAGASMAWHPAIGLLLYVVFGLGAFISWKEAGPDV